MPKEREAEAERKGSTSEVIPAQTAKHAGTTPEEKEKRQCPESPPPLERGTRESSLEPPRTPSRAITPRLMDATKEDDAEDVQSSQPKDKTQ